MYSCLMLLQGPKSHNDIHAATEKRLLVELPVYCHPTCKMIGLQPIMFITIKHLSISAADTDTFNAARMDS
jgi:hypothetical protein